MDHRRGKTTTAFVYFALGDSEAQQDVAREILSIARDLAEGDGAMGMLLRNSRFYDSLLLTVQRIGQTANELKVLVIQWQRKGLMSSVQP